MDERELYLRMRSNPPLPPWLAHPGWEPESIGWRMGGGEDLIYRLSVYFRHCTPEEYEAYVAKYPEVPGWTGWYAGTGLVVGDARLPEIVEETRTLTLLSPDGTCLAVVGLRDGSYRVHLYHRSADGDGDVWEETGYPSLVGDEEDAARMAHELLGEKVE